MLITQLKSKEALEALTEGKTVFLLLCHGCREVHFPEKEAAELVRRWTAAGKVTGVLTTDYICNPENLRLRLQSHEEEIRAAGAVVVFSCGVGVQTVAELWEDKPVYAGSDT